MANPAKQVEIKLTSEQRQLIQQQTGLDVEALELTVEMLEERTSPRCIVVSKDQTTPK